MNKINLKSRKQQSFMLLAVLGIVFMANIFVKALPSYAAENNGQTLSVRVVDGDTQKALSGAKITLEIKENDTYSYVEGMDNLVLSKEGLSLGKLNAGEYRISQVQTPNGYYSEIESLNFVVTDKEIIILDDLGDMSLITEENGKYVLTIPDWIHFIVRLPSTGGTGTMPYIVIGTFFMMTAVGGYFLRRKK